MISYNQKVLRYVYPIFKQGERFPNYFYYSGMDPNQILSALYDSSYVRDCSLKENLVQELLSDLKSFCKLHEIKSSGKKADIIDRISDFCTATNTLYPLKNSYLTLTDAGLSEIDDIKNIPMSVIDFIQMHQNKIEEILQNWNFETLSQVEKIFMTLDFSYIWQDRDTEELSKKILVAFNRLGLLKENISPFLQFCFDIKVQSSDCLKADKFFHGINALLQYKELENSNCNIFKYYTIEHMNDERTCEYCKQFEGRSLPLCNAQVGVNFPPFYKCTSNYCRCFTSPQCE